MKSTGRGGASETLARRCKPVARWKIVGTPGIGEFPNKASGAVFILSGFLTRGRNCNMSEPDQQNRGEQASGWSSEDFAFALHELREEYPTQPPQLITATLQNAAQRISSASGRVKLVQIARELFREA